MILSFVIAGITAALTALCYAEPRLLDPGLGLVLFLRLRHPGRAGAAYGVGWCLLLEYGVSAAAWSRSAGASISTSPPASPTGVRMPDAIS
ncbi:MAG: hypothetical protein U1E17_01210 [Geminicoccaceae bacterium]